MELFKLINYILKSNGYESFSVSDKGEKNCGPGIIPDKNATQIMIL